MIVIDEIHAYDPWTLGLICSSISHFSKFGARFMLMSATMPGYLKNILNEYLPDAEIIEDTELLAKSRNHFSVHFRSYRVSAAGYPEGGRVREEGSRCGQFGFCMPGARTGIGRSFTDLLSFKVYFR